MQTLIPQQPPVSVPVGSKQTRNVPSRTRTGCLTCRRRRIKCDETKPVCNRCQTTNKYCAGQMYQDSARLPTKNKPWELIPNGWETIEASEYYNVVMAQRFPDEIMDFDEEPGGSDEGTQLNDTNAQIIVLFTLSSRIATISTENGIEKRPSALHGTVGMWKQFYMAMHMILQSVNKIISHATATTNSLPDTRKVIIDAGVLSKIQNLIAAENYLGLAEWKIHVNGYFTLLNLLGNPRDFIQNNQRLWTSMIKVIGWTTKANSLAAPENALRCLYSIDVQDIKRVWAHDVCSVFRCPTYLFIQIFIITRLRANLASTGGWNDILHSRACAIFESVHKFDPDTWKEEYPFPDRPEVRFVAKACRLAISLFTILALRMGDSTLGQECLAAHGVDKINLRNDLLETIRASDKYELLHTEFDWHLAVLGVAFADGDAVSKLYIIDRIDLLSRATFFKYGLEKGISQKIQDFWATGKTGWDDCWDEVCIM